MIKLVDQNLSAQNLARLAAYQTQIDTEPDYPAKVNKAKRLWKPQNRTFEKITETLITMCPGTRRCCYCEDARGEDIEHFRPKHLYPDWAFRWENYLFACSACNSNSKRDKFAVLDTNDIFHDVTRAKTAPIVPPIAGEPALINPRYEDPLFFLRLEFNELHFLPRSNLSARDKQRAAYTIEVLELNIRPDLVRWRKSAFKAFVGWIDTYRRYSQTDPTRLAEHITELKHYSHLAVWEEMRRIYRERDPQHWETLILRYPRLSEIDELFTAVPELPNLNLL